MDYINVLLDIRRKGDMNLITLDINAMSWHPAINNRMNVTDYVQTLDVHERDHVPSRLTD